jgi:hypothetical protein
MTRARLDGLYLLLLGSAVFVLLGVALENASPVAMVDFRGLYYPARCLLQHSDPYAGTEVLRIYQAERTDRRLDTERIRQVATQYVNFPTTFSLTAPVAMLRWRPAHLLWIALTIGSLIFAAFLMWDLGADYAPMVSGALIGFLLANSELLVVTGNMAGIAIALCVVAFWCFFRERFVLAGILCLALGLACKPHDTGLVWLYFLLAGGVYRKRALQTLLATVAVSLPAVLWVWHVAPHWMQEWRFNLLEFSAPGAINDPGLSSPGAHGIGMVVSLQEVFGAFWNDPRIYNPASYLICAPLLLVWALATLRYRPSPRTVWLALAAIAALSMLPVYHRQQDTKLLLLTVPACAMLWAEGGPMGWLALVVNSAAFVLTGDLPWAVFFGIIGHMRGPTTALGTQMLVAAQVFPAPVILLVTGVFYLWVYVRRCRAHASPQPLGTVPRKPEASPQGG